MPSTNMSGRKFGRWTVVGVEPERCGLHLQWLCECACGVRRLVYGSSLRQGRSTSCGCLVREKGSIRARRAAAARPQHGFSGRHNTRPVYRVWAAMKRRCLNPKVREFARYGGRGITVCARWMEFENFLADMGEPHPGMSIDRINVDGNYEPGNCRWATATEQSRNQRSNRMLTIDGETLCVAAWAERSGVNKGAVYARLALGWPERDAVFGSVSNRAPRSRHGRPIGRAASV